MSIMRKTFIFLFCFVASVHIAYAQDKMQDIRQRYASAKEYIETHKGTNPNDGADYADYYHLKGQQMMPGTGGHQDDIFMYWFEREEDKIYPSHYLNFATRKYNFAALQYYEEYLYDASGELAFAYIHNPYWSPDGEGEQKEYEFRFYFDRGRMIHTVIKSRANGQQTYKEIQNGSKLDPLYVDVREKAEYDAERIRQMFINMEKVTYDYDE
jgi:hypothetical protein